jgi:phosphopantetheinyl transferase
MLDSKLIKLDDLVKIAIDMEKKLSRNVFANVVNLNEKNKLNNYRSKQDRTTRLNITCAYCKKIGHKIDDCWTLQRVQKTQQNMTYTKLNHNNVNNAQNASQNQLPKGNTAYTNCIQVKFINLTTKGIQKLNEILVPATIYGKTIMCVVDTGASR